MSYQPFLIAPFKTGLDIDLDPWLAPEDAFQSIVNGHIRHGATEKRQGYSKLGDIVYQDQTNWKITGVTQANPGVVTMTDVTGITNGDIIEIRNVTGMTELNGNRYTVANVTGGAGGTFELSGVNTTSFTAYGANGDVYVIPGTRIMGLERYIDSGNVKNLLAFDQARASLYDSSNNLFNPLDSADIMSGSDTDYIWAANWASTASTASATLFRLYFTNGKALSGGLDGIRYYAGGTTTTSFAPSTGTATINGCKLLFAFRNRLVLLHTIEGANTYPQRARWCQNGNPSGANAWDDTVQGRGGYVDAPTGDQIISARQLQDQLIVYFTDSVWTLIPNADPALPFLWRRINDFRGCDGKMATTQYDRYVLSASIRGLTATDAVETRRVDSRITDFVDEEIDAENFDKTFARRSYGSERTWLIYPPLAAGESTAALIYDEDSGAYSTYDISMNVLGYGGVYQDYGIDDLGDAAIDEVGENALQDYTWDKNAEQFLGGDRSGTVWELENGGCDNTVYFETSIINITQANPGVVTMTGDVDLADGDTITISSVAGMTEVNDREFTVTGKSGNSFSLQGIDTSGYTAYTSGGTIRRATATSIDFELRSAAWNPWKQQGKKARLGYVDLLVDSHPSTIIEVSFYTESAQSPYAQTRVNLLPDLREVVHVSNITNANPAVVTAGEHGLSSNDEVYIYGVDGMDIDGGPYIITVIDKDNFSIAVDTSNAGAYINDGIITKLPFRETKVWRRIYAGGVGDEHSLKITTEGCNDALKIHAIMPWFKPVGRRAI